MLKAVNVWSLAVVALQYLYHLFGIFGRYDCIRFAMTAKEKRVTLISEGENRIEQRRWEWI